MERLRAAPCSWHVDGSAKACRRGTVVALIEVALILVLLLALPWIFLYGLGQSLSSHGRFLHGTPGIMPLTCVEHGDALSFRWSSLACGLIRDESRAQFFGEILVCFSSPHGSGAIGESTSVWGVHWHRFPVQGPVIPGAAWAVTYIPVGDPRCGPLSVVCTGEKDITETLHDCESKCGCCENSHSKLD